MSRTEAVIATPHALPQRTATYVGHRTDTRRWDRFTPRPGDILICTPPKCGTTWTQAICAMLVFGQPEFDGQLARISPWVDGNTVSVDAAMHTLEAQRHRRFMKTHTPLDGIPYQPDTTYLMVYRDPRDAYFSLRGHLGNMLSSPDIPAMDPDPRAGFRAWLEGGFQPGAAEQRSLDAFVHHYRSFADFRHLPSFHFFHFADLKRDLRAGVERMARALGIDAAPDTLDAVAQAASFSRMQANPRSFAPAYGMGVWKDDRKFFSRGDNGQWREVLGSAELEAYERRMARLLPPDEAAWLESGSTREDGDHGTQG